jgi:hypothetical protein
LNSSWWMWLPVGCGCRLQRTALYTESALEQSVRNFEGFIQNVLTNHSQHNVLILFVTRTVRALRQNRKSQICCSLVTEVHNTNHKTVTRYRTWMWHKVTLAECQVSFVTISPSPLRPTHAPHLTGVTLPVPHVSRYQYHTCHDASNRRSEAAFVFHEILWREKNCSTCWGSSLTACEPSSFLLYRFTVRCNTASLNKICHNLFCCSRSCSQYLYKPFYCR